jgi:WD40 repeat protein
VIDRCLQKAVGDRISSARELREELEAIARPGALRRLSDDDEANPYAGLAAFQERDSARFFGREMSVEQIITRLAERPLLALVGSSGAGKSSLVRAGVIPALKRGGDAWETFVLRPGAHPLSALAEMLLNRSWQRSSDEDAPPSLREETLTAYGERLRREPGLLGAEMRGRARRRRERALLFVDQFEEVYTLASEAEREAFFACLAGAADDPSSPLRVILSLRHDFLDRVAASASTLAELVSQGAVLVGPLDRRGLRSALITPAELMSHRFESDAMVDEMLDGLSGAATPLPLLQFTAAKLWEARDRGRRLLTLASYRAFGGVSGALASHADTVLGALGGVERRCARALLLRLVTPERTRAIVTRRELSEAGTSSADLDRVLNRLIEARLITVEGARGDESTAELIHESLIVSWPMLGRWMEEEQGDAQFRERLRAAAKAWEASGGADWTLWRGEAADEARRRKRQNIDFGNDMSAREARYLAAVIALDGRERRRRQKLVGFVIAGLSLLVVAVSALAVTSRRAAERADAERAEAQAQKAEAQRSAMTARNATRMAAARELQADPTTVLALLRELEPGPTPRGWAELARWAPQAGVARMVLPHPAIVRVAAFSPDGKRIATGAQDKLVRIWNADGTGEPLVLRGHEEEIGAVAWSPDGRRLVSAAWDKTLRIWNADGSGAPLVLRGHESAVNATSFSPDGKRVVSASNDRTVRVWSADGSGEPLVLRGHEGRVTTAAFSPDGRRVVSAGSDKTLRIWKVEGPGEPLVLRGHDSQLLSARFSPDGERIATTSMDTTLRVWNADGTGEPLVLRGHAGRVYSVAWSPDGKRLATGSQDATVRVWSSDGSGQARILRGHNADVLSVSFSPDGRRVASGSIDKQARVWNLEEGGPVVLRGHEAPVGAATWSPDGRTIASASNDKTLRVWSAEGAGRPLVLRSDTEVHQLSFSPDGARIASTSALEKVARIWSADGNGPPTFLRGHTDMLTCVRWSPDGQRLATVSLDKTVRVWNANGADEPVVLRGHEERVYAASWSPDGRRLASASWDRTVRVWNADGTGEPVVLRGHEAPVYSAVWSPDGKKVISCGVDQTVRIWSPDGATPPLTLRGHEGVINTVDVTRVGATSPDGFRIVSASDDATVRVWSSDGAGEPLVLRASNLPMNSALFAPDGRRIAAASEDMTIVVWSDLEPLTSAEDMRLWRPSAYCIPLETRQRLLGFSEEQSRADLEGCQRRAR